METNTFPTISSIGAQIRTLRKANGTSLQKLADDAGMSVRRLQAIESGAATDIRLTTLCFLAKALDVPTCKLLAHDGCASQAACSDIALDSVRSTYQALGEALAPILGASR